MFPDHFVPARRAGSRERVEKAVLDLEPGVTELHIQPAVDTPEVRAFSSSWAEWVDDHALATQEPSLRRALEDQGAVLIGFRELRALMT